MIEEGFDRTLFFILGLCFCLFQLVSIHVFVRNIIFKKLLMIELE